MLKQRKQQAYELTWLVRRLFRAMAASADQYLADAGLTAKDRALMEFLYDSEPLAVPDLARRYQVSRQHVQTTVNALLQRGLLLSIENPGHKRSRLIRLSDLGSDTFAAIRENENRIIDELFRGISDAALQTTRETLTLLLQRFS